MNHDIKTDIRNYYSFWFGINALYEAWAKKHGLTSNALFTLYIIHESPTHCTQRFICERLLLPKQTVNTILDSFEKKGYITKKVMSEDRRNKHVLLTESGMEYTDRLLAELYHFEEQALLSMAPENRAGMIENSHLFLNRLSTLWK